MIRCFHKLIKNDSIIAVSGGPDSMAALDFLSKGKKNISAAYFNHGTEHGKEAEEFVYDYCKLKGISLKIGRADRDRTKSESPEEYWRNIRYGFFSQFSSDIITCHHLDDQVEQWIMTSLTGNPALIPGYNRERKIVRPFLMTKKFDFLDWCNRFDVPYLKDPSNSDNKYMRSFVRSNLIPKALVVNPGLHKVIYKKVFKNYEKDYEIFLNSL